MKTFIFSCAVSFVFFNFGMKEEKFEKLLKIKQKEHDIDRTYKNLVKNFWQEFSGKESETEFVRNYTISFADKQYIMQASVEDIQKNLKEESKELSNFLVRQVKYQSFKNLQSQTDDKKLWLGLFNDDFLKNKSKELNYLLNCNAIKVFLGLCSVERFNCEIPVATNMMYCAGDTVTFFSAFEEIKREVTASCKEINAEKTIKINELHRKQMLYKALKNVPDGTKKIVIASSKQDKNFFESIGMKNTSRLKHYALKKYCSKE